MEAYQILRIRIELLVSGRKCQLGLYVRGLLSSAFHVVGTRRRTSVGQDEPCSRGGKEGRFPL